MPITDKPHKALIDCYCGNPDHEYTDGREAYTLLCSAEPALIRGVAQAPNPTSRHYQQLLLDKVKQWIQEYRDAQN
jgi:hypothetical protein